MYYEVLRQRVASLSLVNHFLKRLRNESRPEKCAQSTDPRCLLPYAKRYRLGMSLPFIIMEQEANLPPERNGGDVRLVRSPYLFTFQVRASSEPKFHLTMKREETAGLPLCPEQRLCRHGFTHSADYDVLDPRKEVSRPHVHSRKL